MEIESLQLEWCKTMTLPKVKTLAENELAMARLAMARLAMARLAMACLAMARLAMSTGAVAGLTRKARQFP